MTVAVRSILDDLEPVSLAELTATADLQTRRDRKYLVPIEELDGLIDEQREDLRALTIDGERAFAYESVYFDTPNLVSFLGAARRWRRRFKVRTRSYLDSGVSLLEVKLRDGRGQTVKHRVPHPIGDRCHLTREDRRLLASFDPIGDLAVDLQPTITTDYSRSTLLARDGRVTIDVHLRWQLPDGNRIELPTSALVETKSPGRPTDFDRTLWRAGHRPVSLSKYATGLAALHGGLPANRWHRVLNDHFLARGDLRMVPATSNATSSRAGLPLVARAGYDMSPTRPR